MKKKLLMLLSSITLVTASAMAGIATVACGSKSGGKDEQPKLADISVSLNQSLSDAFETNSDDSLAIEAQIAKNLKINLASITQLKSLFSEAFTLNPFVMTFNESFNDGTTTSVDWTLNEFTSYVDVKNQQTDIYIQKLFKEITTTEHGIRKPFINYERLKAISGKNVYLITDSKVATITFKQLSSTIKVKSKATIEEAITDKNLQGQIINAINKATKLNFNSNSDSFMVKPAKPSQHLNASEFLLTTDFDFVDERQYSIMHRLFTNYNASLSEANFKKYELGEADFVGIVAEQSVYVISLDNTEDFKTIGALKGIDFTFTYSPGQVSLEKLQHFLDYLTDDDKSLAYQLNKLPTGKTKTPFKLNFTINGIRVKSQLNQPQWNKLIGDTFNLNSKSVKVTIQSGAAKIKYNDIFLGIYEAIAATANLNPSPESWDLQSMWGEDDSIFGICYHYGSTKANPDTSIKPDSGSGAFDYHPDYVLTIDFFSISIWSRSAGGTLFRWYAFSQLAKNGVTESNTPDLTSTPFTVDVIKK